MLDRERINSQGRRRENWDLGGGGRRKGCFGLSVDHPVVQWQSKQQTISSVFQQWADYWWTSGNHNSNRDYVCSLHVCSTHGGQYQIAVFGFFKEV